MNAQLKIIHDHERIIIIIIWYYIVKSSILIKARANLFMVMLIGNGRLLPHFRYLNVQINPLSSNKLHRPRNSKTQIIERNESAGKLRWR